MEEEDNWYDRGGRNSRGRVNASSEDSLKNMKTVAVVCEMNLNSSSSSSSRDHTGDIDPQWHSVDCCI